MELDGAGKHALKTESRDTGISLDWYPPEQEFKDKKQVEVYNLSSGTCETRLRDDQRAERLGKEFENVLQALALRFEDLREDMRQGYEKFRTRAFWNEYLDVKQKEAE